MLGGLDDQSKYSEIEEAANNIIHSNDVAEDEDNGGLINDQSEDEEEEETNINEPNPDEEDAENEGADDVHPSQHINHNTNQNNQGAVPGGRFGFNDPSARDRNHHTGALVGSSDRCAHCMKSIFNTIKNIYIARIVFPTQFHVW